MKPTPLTNLFFLILCLATQPNTAQILNKPTPAPNPNIGSSDAWNAVCASDSFNDYYVNFTWSPPLVGSSNEFILELSDANGNFSNPIELDRLGDKNTVFDFDFRFSIPQNIQGDNYRFRVRSTSPALTSSESDSYAMYFIDYTNPILISRNGDGVIPNGGKIQICDGGTATLATHNVPNPETYQYSWYRSGTPLSESSNTLTVSQTGVYFVEIDYGYDCSGSANTLSNYVQVSFGSGVGIAINTPSQTALCPSDSVLLEANISGLGYTYTWLKNGVIVSGPTVNASSYLVDGNTAGFEGDYTVKVSDSGTCEEESSAVTITSGGGFTVTRENPSNVILFSAQPSQVLSISTNASNPTIQWYKDGSAISSANNLTLTVTEVGDYYAIVTETGGTCGSSTKTSETTSVIQPGSFELSIAYDGDYTECDNSNVSLAFSELTTTVDGMVYNLVGAIEYADLKWVHDSVDVAGETNTSISLNAIEQNGSYYLYAKFPDATIDSIKSNSLDVKLNSGETITVSTTAEQLCDGNSVTLSTSFDLNGRSFEWLKNGQPVNNSVSDLVVTEEGVYQLSVATGEACPITSNEVSISRFDDSAIRIDANEPIIIVEGSSKTITATGATAYEWYDSQNNLLSTSASANIASEGQFLLLASVDDCQITKTFNVTYKDNFQVPNVITANGDGINDLWVLPNTYSKQPDVTVIIYNELGEEFFNQREYANNWPSSSVVFSKKNHLFYYKIKRDNQTIKQGTLTVIK